MNGCYQDSRVQFASACVTYLAAACWTNYQLGVAAHALERTTTLVVLEGYELYCTIQQLEAAVSAR